MSKQHMVLIVDDTPENIDVLVGVLKDKYKLKVATSGKAALEIMAEKKKPDLVLPDHKSRPSFQENPGYFRHRNG